MVLDKSGSLPWHRKKQWISPTIFKLRKDILSGNKSSIDRFWGDLEKEGTPLIENIRDKETHKLVTFVVKADEDTRNVVIICALADQDVLSPITDVKGLQILISFIRALSFSMEHALFTLLVKIILLNISIFTII